MKTKLILFIAVSFLMTSVCAQNDLEAFFTGVDDFMTKYVSGGRVDYQAIAKDQDQLKSLYEIITQADLSGKDDLQIKAFYVNAYNILVIYQVVERYPLKGPLTVNGFFSNIKHTVAGKVVTLDGLEKGILLKKYPDARIHFAVVCAAVGCPQLGSFAFLPEKLEEQLNERTESSLNSNYFIRVDDNKSRVEISQIFEWYNSDFTKEQSTLDFINQYRAKKIPQNYKLRYYEYDWALNDKK